MGTSSKQKSTVKVTTPEPTAEENLARQKSDAANTLAMDQAGYTWGTNEAGVEGWQKRPLTADEQQQADRDKQINDLLYKKLTGEISPEDKALVEKAYSSARDVGTSDMNAELSRALEQLNMTAGEEAAARGMGVGDTPIAGAVSKNKRLLGEDFARNLRTFETGLSGAQASSMLDVGQRQQLFGEALREFQANLKQQNQMNVGRLGESFANTALGLGSLRSRNITQVSTGLGSSGQSASSIMGGAGGLMQGIGSLWSSFGSSAASASSRQFKDNIEAVDIEQVLAELESMPVYTWNYKPEFDGDGRKHIGPVTEESPSIMVSSDGKRLLHGDCLGLLFAAVKSLSEKIKRLEKGD